jgi:hypothetical protein
MPLKFDLYSTIFKFLLFLTKLNMLANNEILDTPSEFISQNESQMIDSQQSSS